MKIKKINVLFWQRISDCDEFMQRLMKFVEVVNPEHGSQDGADGEIELKGGGGSEMVD